MSIKQQGGIFGRNPTFNDVDVEGTLTVNGEPISDFGTMAQQDADSVNIDGGSIDGVSLGTNSAVTEADIDNLNINGNTISTTNTNGNLTIAPNGLGIVEIDTTITADDSQGTEVIKVLPNSVKQGMLGITMGRNFDRPNREVSFGYYAGDNFGQGPSFGVQMGSTLAMRVHDSGRISVPNGGGIWFVNTPDATGSTSELLDDYEQGTFTPVVKGTTSNPSVTSGTAYGRYTKIGNRVFGNVYMRQVWSSAGSGTLYVDGFPYVMFENHFPGISLGLTDLVGTISNGYLTTVYGTSGCAAVLTGASGVTGSNRYITFMFQYVTGEN